MHLRSLSLRNYRVYRELDLDFPDGLIGIYGPNGAGKCIPGHVRVYDAEQGGMLPISQFVAGKRKRTLGYHEGRVQHIEVLDWIQLGERPTVEVELEDGSSLELAATHPVLTATGCVKASELTNDHWVALAAATPQCGPAWCSVDEATLLGLLLGDGTLSETGVGLTCADPDTAQLFREVAGRVFHGADVTEVRKQGTTTFQYTLRSALSREEKRALCADVIRRLRHADVPLEPYAGLRSVHAVLRGTRSLSWKALCGIEDDYGIDLFEERCRLYPAQALLEWVRSFGLLGAVAGTKFIPPQLLTLPDEQTWALLAGLWLTDGWVVPGDDKPQAGLRSKSRQLAEDIRHLLIRVGVRSSLRSRKVQGSQYWLVSISVDGLDSLGSMPLVGDKAARRDVILNWWPRRRAASGDRIPPSFNARSTSWTSTTGAYRSTKQRHDEVRWVPVRSVRDTGRTVECFDLEVDTPEHLYLAENFVVHNSTLVEAIRYSIYGDARTPKDELRSGGVGEDMLVTLVFEHEGNTYEVRRALKGVNLTPTVQVFRNGQLTVSSVRDANALLARVIGMSPSAFLASVCAQQKELTAFATMQGAERRKLVMDLLGVSPVERALTRTRESARTARSEASGARQALAPLEELEKAAAGAEAELAAATTEAARTAEAEQAATAELTAKRAATTVAEQAVKELEELASAARLARAEAAQHRIQATGHEQRAAEADLLLPKLREAEARASGLPAATAALDELDRAYSAHLERLGLARAVRDAAGRLTTAERVRAEADADAAGATRLAGALTAAEAAVTEAEQTLAATRERYAAARADRDAARRRVQTAEGAVEAAGALDPGAPCPTCGQELGDAFEAVRGHRVTELDAAKAELTAAEATLAALHDEGTAGKAVRDRLVAARDAARADAAKAERAKARAEAAATAQATTAAELAERELALAAVPDPAWDERAHEQARAAVDAARQAVTEVAGFQARTGMADEERRLAKSALAAADEADGRGADLETRSADLPVREAELAAARAAEQVAAAAATTAHGAGQRAAAALAGARRRNADQATALERARAAHERVAALDEDAAYLERLTALVSGFRTHLVSRLGARLGAETARLFADLTDSEYADLEVDPETYAVRIVDGGIAHELSRFSGSENDLASLSLRVAISLVIAESAGELGLLVLDEVLGSLDRDRRERMLAALTSLQGRFRQVLLVTHNEEVKDLLPIAIEVTKGQGRTSTARLVG